MPMRASTYYGFRYYEPNSQRWVNADPLGDISSLPLVTAECAPSTLLEDSDETTSSERLGEEITRRRK